MTAFHTINRDRLVPTIIESNPAFKDYINAIDQLFDAETDNNIDALSQIRDLDVNSERFLLVNTIKMLGLPNRTDIFSADRLFRIFTYMAKYRHESGTKYFVDFLGFLLDKRMEMDYLYTEDYFAQFPEPFGTLLVSDTGEVYNETAPDDNGWYRTTHVQLRVDPTSWFPTAFDAYKDLEDFFYQFAPAYIVLDFIGNIAPPFEGRYDIAIGAVSSDNYVINKFDAYEALDVKDHWEQLENLPCSISGHTQNLMGDDTILITGGYTGNQFNESFCFRVARSGIKWRTDITIPDKNKSESFTAFSTNDEASLFLGGTSDGDILQSIDGVTYTLLFSVQNAVINSILWIEDISKWVIATSTGDIYQSTDNTVTWTRFLSGITTDIKQVIFADDIYLLISGTRIYRSADAEQWLEITSFEVSLNCVTYNEAVKLFLLVGDCGQAWTSVDSETWVKTEVGFVKSDILTCATGNNKFIVGGSNSRLSTSNDGFIWTLADPLFRNEFSTDTNGDVICDDTNKPDVTLVGYIGGTTDRFLAISGTGYSLSPDGFTWTRYKSPFPDEDTQLVASGIGEIPEFKIKASSVTLAYFNDLAEVIVLGGENGNLNISFGIFTYATATPLPVKLANHAASDMSDYSDLQNIISKAFITGGESASVVSNNTYAYDNATNAWISKANLPIVLKDHQQSFIKGVAGATKWAYRDLKLGDCDPLSVTYDTSTDTYMVTGCDSKVSISDSFGVNWVNVTNNIPSDSIVESNYNINRDEYVFYNNTSTDIVNRRTRDFITWEETSTGITPNLTDIEYITGRSDLLVFASEGIVKSKNTLINWETANIGLVGNIKDAIYASEINTYLVITDTEVAISNNAVDWFISRSIVDVIGGNTIEGVAFDSVNHNFLILLSDFSIIGSSNGDDWRDENISLTTTATTIFKTGYSVSDSLFYISVGGGIDAEIHTSATWNGTWTVTVVSVPLPIPTIDSLTTATTGGTLVDGTYTYRLVLNDGTNDTLPSSPVTIILTGGTATQTITINSTAVPGTIVYKVYGRTSGSELLTVSSVSPVITDDGTVTPAGALPTTHLAVTLSGDSQINNIFYDTTNSLFYYLLKNNVDNNLYIESSATVNGVLTLDIVSLVLLSSLSLGTNTVDFGVKNNIAISTNSGKLYIGLDQARILRRNSFTPLIWDIQTVQIEAPTNLNHELLSGILTKQTAYYQVTAHDANGETLGTQALSIDIPETSDGIGVSLSWDSSLGATGYNVYGRSLNAMQLIGTVEQPTLEFFTTLSFFDDGSTTPTTAIPTSNTTGLAGTTTPINLVIFDPSTAFLIIGDSAGTLVRSLNGVVYSSLSVNISTNYVAFFNINDKNIYYALSDGENKPFESSSQLSWSEVTTYPVSANNNIAVAYNDVNDIFTIAEANGDIIRSIVTDVVLAPFSIILGLSTNAGTLVAGTEYSYRVSAYNILGESLASFEKTLVMPIGSTTSLDITWDKVDNATGYRVYGRTLGSELLLIDIANNNTLLFNDTGALTPLGALPMTNTSYLASGTVWSTIAAGLTNVQDLIFIDDKFDGDTGFLAVGLNGLISQSLDGGLTWVDKSSLFLDMLNGASLTTVDIRTVTFAYIEELNDADILEYKTFIVIAGDNGLLAYTNSLTTPFSLISITNENLTKLNHIDAEDRVIVVGDNGFIASSNNITTWSTHLVNTPVTLNNVHTGNDTFAKYLAIGDRGTILTGITLDLWISRDSPFFIGDMHSVTTDDAGLWVAVFDSATIYRSTNNGTSWVQSTNNVPNNNDLFSITYSTSLTLFVVVGTNGTIVTSPDGITWTNQTSNVTTDLLKVIFDNSLFIITGTNGTILTSSNGTTWVDRTVENSIGLTIRQVAFGLTKFIAVADSAFYLVSEDNGVTWDKFSITNKPITQTGDNTLKTTGYAISERDLKKYISLAELQAMITRAQAQLDLLQSSTENNSDNVLVNYYIEEIARLTLFLEPKIASDERNAELNKGINSSTDVSNVLNFTAITFGLDTFVMGSSTGDIYISTDGINWTFINIDLQGSRVNDLSFDNNQFVLLSTNGKLAISQQTITDKILISGGTTSGTALNTSFLYDVALDSWSASANMNTARKHHAQGIFTNNDIIVAGGVDDTNAATLTCELYVPAVNEWVNITSMPYVKTHGAMSVSNQDYAIFTGGTINLDHNALVFIRSFNAPDAPILLLGTGVLDAGTYYYRVSAATESGETVPSAESVITIESGGVIFETTDTDGLVVTLNKNGSGVILNWKPVLGATKYFIYGRDKGSNRLLATTNNKVTRFNDTGIDILQDATFVTTSTVNDTWFEINKPMPLPRSGHAQSMDHLNNVIFTGGYSSNLSFKYKIEPDDFIVPLNVGGSTYMLPGYVVNGYVV